MRLRFVTLKQGPGVRVVAKSREELEGMTPPERKKHAITVLAGVFRGGHSPRLPCCACGKFSEYRHKKSHAHHEDYCEPLRVVFLCSQHHRLRHSELSKSTAFMRRLTSKPRITTSNASNAVYLGLKRLAKLNRRSAPMQALIAIEKELGLNLDRLRAKAPKARAAK